MGLLALCPTSALLWAAEMRMNQLATGSLSVSSSTYASLCFGKVLRDKRCHWETKPHLAHYANVMSLLLFMLLMPHPVSDIIALPSFVWLCHRLTNTSEELIVFLSPFVFEL